MSLNARMKGAKLMLVTIKNSRLLNRMTLIARSVGNQCVKSIRQFQPYLKLQGFTQQITDSYAHLWISSVQNIKVRSRHSQVIHMLDKAGTLTARALQGAHCEPLKRRARGVAFVIGISLLVPMAHANSGSIEVIKSIKELANEQLTDKQYHCHNQITYLESRDNLLAVNGSHYGIYQGRSKALKGASADYQFYWYWYYVSNRYGVTQYDEPMYCVALHHLYSKGWQ